MPNVESDWDEALQLLSDGEPPRAALAAIVREEIERLQRFEKKHTRSVPMRAKHRERVVALVWEKNRPALTMSVAVFDETWLAQLFMDSIHESADLRFRPVEPVGQFSVALFEPGEEQAGDYVFQQMRGHRMLSDGSAEFYFFVARMVEPEPEDVALLLPMAKTEPAPPLVPAVDVSATVPL